MKIIKTEKLRFISWADNLFGDVPKPVRRILSLMRLNETKRIILEERSWDEISCRKECWSSYQTGAESCSVYIDNLKKLGCEFKNKKCFRLSFFNTVFDKDNDIKCQTDSNYLGYCIIQEDEIIDKNKNLVKHIYVPESILNLSFRKGRYALTSVSSSKQKIAGTIFNIRGNYFCQQNGLTNSCSNAAIKMALREYFPDITAEEINRAIGIDHITKKANKGLESKEICKVVKTLANIDSFLLNSADLESPDLMKTIYHAIESRLPIIVNFSMQTEEDTISSNNLNYDAEELDNEGLEGHSVSIKGHTFNEHNWWSYGTRFYFTKDSEFKYMPSYLWCDNFVIQDDNMGPYYVLPVQFLSNYFFKETFLIKILRAIGFKNNNRKFVNGPFKGPFQVIIMHPEKLNFFKEQLPGIESSALSSLDKYVSYLPNKIKIEEKYITYFGKYYKTNNLILRTFVITKNEYVKFIERNSIAKNNSLIDVLDKYLAEVFWVTEISIPELFWVNKKKIGEIIVDPTQFGARKDHGAVLIRLLDRMAFIRGDKIVEDQINYQIGTDHLLRPDGKIFKQ